MRIINKITMHDSIEKYKLTAANQIIIFLLLTLYYDNH